MGALRGPCFPYTLATFLLTIDCCCQPQVLVEILSDLRLGQFEVKLNHRRLLDAMLEIAGAGLGPGIILIPNL